MSKPIQLNPYWYAYRGVMRLAHRFNWHHTVTLNPDPDGSQLIWCQWCGLRMRTPPIDYALIPGPQKGKTASLNNEEKR